MSTPKTISIPVKRTFTHCMLSLALFFIFMHFATMFIHFHVGEFPYNFWQLFDLDEEHNYPTWFSSFLLLSTSALLVLCLLKDGVKGKWRFHWMALALGFLVLSIDEIAGLHETINTVTETSWIGPAAVLLVFIGVPFLWFLIKIPRGFAVLSVIGGLMYVSGLLGFEKWGEMLLDEDKGDTIEYYYSTLLEEGFEMLGVVVFQYGIFRYLGRDKIVEVELEKDTAEKA